jgi:3alpha(or 20beta)-hydroxysteroid dehydrogenase
MGRLDGKVALITGAARGQGEAAARLFTAEGAKVVLGDILDDAGKAVAASLGDAAIYLRHDVSQEDSWANFVSIASESFGRIDVLMNNAGIIHVAPVAQITLENYMKVVNVNQVGCLLGMRSVIPAMVQAGGGSIINVSSTTGMEGAMGLVAYVSTKFAIRGMTKTAALELGRVGIRVASASASTRFTPEASTRRWATGAWRTSRTSMRRASSTRSRWGGSEGRKRRRRWPSSWPPTSPPIARDRSSWPTAACSQAPASPERGAPGRFERPQERRGEKCRLLPIRLPQPMIGPRREMVLNGNEWGPGESGERGRSLRTVPVVSQAEAAG